MTDNNDDVLVKKFFSENRIDVPDDGFSRRAKNVSSFHIKCSLVFQGTHSHFQVVFVHAHVCGEYSGWDLSI